MRRAARSALLLVAIAAPVARAQEAPPGEQEPASGATGLAEPEAQQQPPAEAGSPAAGAPTPPAGEQPPDASSEEPELPAEYTTFELPLPPEKGGGTVAGSAGTVEFVRKDLVRLSDGVEVRYRDIKVQAQSMVADLAANELTAEGEVILDQGPRRLTGVTLRYNLDEETGILTDAAAYVDPDFFFVGEEIAKVGEDLYTVRSGVFTSCTDRVPDWSFKVAYARVRVEGFARAHHARMRIKQAPFLYLPYILWPAKSGRTSGLLFPNIGFSERRGTYLGLAWFQTLGRSYDTTFFVDLYGEDYYGLGDEVRYVPSETTEGVFRGYAIEDGVLDETRWKVDWNHVSEELPLGFRGVISYRDYSDFEFFRDFERDFNDASLRSVYASAYASKSEGPHSFNLLLDDRETFISSRTISQRQLPELEYRLRPTQLGGVPVYLELLSSANYFSTRRSADLQSEYGRADLRPEFTVPVSSWPWLSASLSTGGRVTWYEDSVDPETGAFGGDSLSRLFPNAGADIVGPSFSRIFDGDLGPFDKFKHIVEPRWTYAYAGDFDEQERVPLFDEVDNVRPVNVGSFALVNRVLAKPRPGVEGDTREILSFEVAQAYSFDEDQPLERASDGLLTSQRGPLVSRLRFNPDENLTLDAQVNYSVLFDELASTSLSSSYDVGSADFAVTWFTRLNPEQGETTSNQVRFFTGFDIVPQRLRIDAQLNYDFELAFFQQQRYIFHYTSECYGVRLELRELNLGDRRERDYRFAVDLKNVGTFLDLNGGLSSTEP